VSISARKADSVAKGFVLITTLIVLAVLSAFCLSLSYQVRLHMVMNRYDQDERRVRRLLDDGIEYARHLLGSGSARPFPYAFVPVDATVLGYTDNEEIGLFIVEVGGKLNINRVNDALLKDVLVEVTGSESEAEQLEENIRDWIDLDNVGYAENDFYITQDPPYRPRNGEIARLEELLYVKDMSIVTFHGEDANHNLILEPNENDGDRSYPPDNRDGAIQLGVRDYFTVGETNALNINSAPPHVWGVLFRSVVQDEPHRAAILVQRVTDFLAGADRTLGSTDDQQFESVDSLGSVLGTGGNELVEQLNNLYPLAVDPTGYEVTIRAALNDERITRTVRIVLKLEDGSLLMASHQDV